MNESDELYSLTNHHCKVCEVPVQ